MPSPSNFHSITSRLVVMLGDNAIAVFRNDTSFNPDGCWRTVPRPVPFFNFSRWLHFYLQGFNNKRKATAGSAIYSPFQGKDTRRTKKGEKCIIILEIIFPRSWIGSIVDNDTFTMEIRIEVDNV